MTGDHDHDWEEDKKLVERFEDSLKSNLDLYFEEEELEDIIRFYFDQQKFLKALRASEYALEKFPFSVEIRLQKAQCLIFNDELEEGLGILEHLNNLSPNNEDIVLALANAQILAGSWKITYPWQKIRRRCFIPWEICIEPKGTMAKQVSTLRRP